MTRDGVIVENVTNKRKVEKMSVCREYDPRRFLPYLLNRAAEASSLEFQQEYKSRYGMLRTEWRVMFHLGIYGRMTAREIGEKAGIHKTKISRAVAKLAQRRYITRERDENDRRSEFLALTKEGARVYSDLSKAAQKVDEKLVATFSDEECAVLRGALEKLAGLSLKNQA